MKHFALAAAAALTLGTAASADTVSRLNMPTDQGVSIYAIHLMQGGQLTYVTTPDLMGEYTYSGPFPVMLVSDLDVFDQNAVGAYFGADVVLVEYTLAGIDGIKGTSDDIQRARW